MTQSIEYIINDDDGQRVITITPVNLNLGNDILYSTGEYALSEGAVGLGTVVVQPSGSYSYDGFGDISAAEIAMVVSYIRRRDPLLANRRPEVAASQPPVVIKTDVEPPGMPNERLQTTTNAAAPHFTFIAQNGGKPVDVRVTLTYPIYDISVAGKPVAKLQQDHHGNWFVASGTMDDGLVQEVGARINREVRVD